MLNSDDFFDSAADDFDFDSDDGYQTDTDDAAEEEAAEPETAEESAEDGAEEDQETEDEPGNAEDSGEASAEDAEKPGTEGEAGTDGADSEQKFTIKVNKENREVGLQEMTELAQKGADYDRIKGHLEASRQNEQAMQSKLDAQNSVMEVLNLISEQSGTPLETLIDQLYVNFQKGNGKSETEARQALENGRLKKENEELKALQTRKDAAVDDVSARAQRDLVEFRKYFPDVVLSDELVEKMMPDIQSGMSMTNSYLNLENARKDAENAELQRRLAASEQNKKNRSRTPGSMRDSGGSRTVDLADIFERELFK